ncbi:hypothetical protein HDU67_004258 [Dinochytrium kinnereticum]|nr:hypothetical protein HDU67_004258 [Dinochytrium kinnereticum]
MLRVAGSKDAAAVAADTPSSPITATTTTTDIKKPASSTTASDIAASALQSTPQLPKKVLQAPVILHDEPDEVENAPQPTTPITTNQELERQEPPPKAPPFIPEAKPGLGQWTPPPKPLAVKLMENWTIPLPGGTKLSARVWMPRDALAGKKFSGILEFVPHRKRDFTALQDEIMHPFFASRGFVVVRCDMRGSGDSTGILEDEYTPQELEDAIAVIKFIANAPWCTGSVGMMGKGWGGFNALQVACLQPAELKAIVTVCSTDDRYEDDAHYLGGYRWVVETKLHPANTEHNSMNMLKPMDRIIDWVKHQRRDWYYKHGSVCEDYSRITTPVFCVGGWADSYTRPIFNMMERLNVPRKGKLFFLILRVHSPIDFVKLLSDLGHIFMLDGTKTGLKDEANCQIYLQDAIPPSSHGSTRPGHWLGLSSWPSDQVEFRKFYFSSPGKLCDDPSKEKQALALVKNNLKVGQAAPRFCASGGDPEMPTDQGEDDLLCVCFDSEPFEHETNLLGSPTVNLTVTVNKPQAILVARLCDVNPTTKESFLIGWSPLNLTHHTSHSDPEALPTDGTLIPVKITMKHISHTVKPGRVIRLALSTSYWPLVWPSPYLTEVHLAPDNCSLELPLLLGSGDALVSRHLVERARGCQPRNISVIRHETPAQIMRTKDRNQMLGATRFDVDGWVYGESTQETYTLQETDPTSASVECRWRVECGRPQNISPEALKTLGQIQVAPTLAEPHPMAMDNEAASRWRGIVRVDCRVRLSCTEKEYCIDAELRGYENGRIVSEGKWEDVRIARDHV